MVYLLIALPLLLLLGLYFLAPKEYAAAAAQVKAGGVRFRRRLVPVPILDELDEPIDLDGRMVGYASGPSMEPWIRDGGVFVARMLSDPDRASLGRGDVVVINVTTTTTSKTAYCLRVVLGNPVGDKVEVGDPRKSLGWELLSETVALVEFGESVGRAPSRKFSSFRLKPVLIDEDVPEDVPTDKAA